VIVTDVAVLLVWARGLPAAAPPGGSARRLSLGEDSLRRPPDTALMAASLIVLMAATVLPLLLLYSKSAYSAILVQSLKSLEIMWSIMLEGRRRRNEAMKYMPGLESVGSRALICRIISKGFMSPISGNFSSSNALAQRSLVYLDTSRAFSCSYVSAAYSSISSRLSLMFLQTSVGRDDSRWSYFVHDDWVMLQILNLRNQVVGSCGPRRILLRSSRSQEILQPPQQGFFSVHA
jgi:hypothetical protein